MGVRLERSTQSAIRIAKWLKSRPEVAQVLCPMMPGDSGHKLWRRDFTGGCGLFSIVLRGEDRAASARLVDNLELFGIGYSWGGYESLALPFDPSGIRDTMRWPPQGVDDGLRSGVRLSIGLEDPDDLIADLAQGLTAMGSIGSAHV